MAESTIVIPVFNQSALTAQCLASLRAEGQRRMVVVDDGSTDDTAQMLAGQGGDVRVITHAANAGFATSCNDGVALADTEFVVLLNNDTVPHRGWLEALERYAHRHPEAAVVGGKLLYPDHTIQHAGVVICQDRYPRHLYAGFPAEHPAVNRSRRFQIVTAACMLVRRELFLVHGGFDAAFRNGFEDVDFCLRLGAAGHEIHYCHESVLDHYESVSPQRFRHDRENVARYRQRWLERAQPDDLGYYVADGLLEIDYEGRYPCALRVSPLLATIDGPERAVATEQLLRSNSWRIAELLHENTRLRVELGALGKDSRELHYRELRGQIHEAVRRVLPPDAFVLVISKGDGALLDMNWCHARHFPQTERGAYTGHHPADSNEAITRLEALRASGAEYLLIPATSRWWLEHYHDFGQHLAGRYECVLNQEGVCVVYSLCPPPRQKHEQLAATPATICQ